jgi:hypothetical protein
MFDSHTSSASRRLNSQSRAGEAATIRSLVSRSLRTARLGAIFLVGGQLAACQGGGETSNDQAPSAPPAALPVRSGLAGRLTTSQHQNIVEDLLGVKLDALALAAAGGGLPQEQPSTGLFRNGADGQAAADDYPLAFGTLAALTAERVDIVALGAAVAPCADTASTCDRLFVDGLGKRLFRRGLTDREGAAFAALHARVLAEGVGAEQARRGVLEAMLQSPAFVFRLERELGGQPGEKRYLDGFELSSRLSFFLWESTPDDELLALASNGSLSGSPSSVPLLRAQVRRMLAEPRARRLTRGFVRDFSGVERAAFVGVTPVLRASLLDSMVATVDSQLWQAQGRIQELFTLTQMTLDPSTAQLVGLAPAGDGLRVYDLSALPQRVGWLTHPAFIAGMGDAQVGKIVHRGITLMVKLMCRQPVQLPDGLEATTSEFNRTFADLTERQRSEQRRAMASVAQGGTSAPTCWACHSQFEPLAYGFGRFDAAGRYLGEVDSLGRPLPIDGWMTDDLSVDEAARARYRDVAELMSQLAESETVQACLVEHFLALGTGRASSAVEKAFALPVLEAQRHAGGTLQAMVEAVAESELFRSLASSGPAPL